MLKKFVSTFIIGLIITLTVLFFLIPKKDMSENENRYLEKFPNFSIQKLIDGRYIKGVENYLTDHFAFRDMFMGIKSFFEVSINQKLINGVYVGKDEYLFQKFNPLNDSERIIKTLNNFEEKINENKTNRDKIDVTLMLVPSSGSIYDEKLPKYVDFDDEIKKINIINEGVKFNSIKLVEALRNSKNKYNLFYRLDHHWTIYGAYIAYSEMCKNKNLDIKDISDIEINSVSNSFDGTLFSKANIYWFKSDKMDSCNINLPIKVEYVVENKETNTLYEDKYLNVKDKYSYYLDSNHSTVVIRNEDKTPNKYLDNILIVKDSYANCFAPFLLYNYKNVHLIDLRYFSGNVSEYIKENEIREVLILYNVQNIFGDSGIYKLK